MAVQPSNKELSTFFKRLGAKVRKLRHERGMVQEDMLSFGFATRHYQRIEAGLPINIKTAIRLCRVFKIKLPDLFNDL